MRKLGLGLGLGLGLEPESDGGFADDWEYILRQMVDEVVEDVLMGEEIPNLLIDVLTNKTAEYDPFSEEEQMVFDICREVMIRVIGEESRHVVTQYLREFVQQYLTTMAGKSREHPLVALVDGLIQEVLAKTHREIVKETIAEMVDEYLFLHSFEDYLYQALHPIITSVAIEANQELAMEYEAEFLVNGVVAWMCEDVTQEIMAEMAHEVDRRQEAFMITEVSNLSQTIIDNVLLEELMKAVANRGESIAMRECLADVKHTHLAHALLGKIRSTLDVQQEIASSRPLRLVHQLLCTSAIFPPMLLELEKEMHVEAALADEEESRLDAELHHLR